MVDGQFHTNNIEGFWSGFKRTVVGTYHYMSPKHLQRCMHESSCRYNTRRDDSYDRFSSALELVANGRLRYVDLVKKAPTRNA